MGGHGGLNILPQKSWNVYNRSNREKVAADEAKAATEAAAAEAEAHALKAEASLQHMRERAGAGHISAPQKHVNLFAEAEAAEGRARKEAEKRAEEARVVARIMPDLQLDRSNKEPTPWYALASAGNIGMSTAYTKGSGAAAGSNQGSLISGTPTRAMLEHEAFATGSCTKSLASSMARSSMHEVEAKEQKKAHKHSKRHHKDRREHTHSRRDEERDHRRDRKLECRREKQLQSAPSLDLERLRRERLERERLEHSRSQTAGADRLWGDSHDQGPSGNPRLTRHFLELTGQIVGLKPGVRRPLLHHPNRH